MRQTLTGALGALLMSAALPAWADDVALVIGNGAYRNLDNVAGGARVARSARDLEDEGIDVLSLTNASRSRALDALNQFVQISRDADGVIVVLSGRFLRTGYETYFMPVDSRGPDFVDVPGEAISMSTILAILAEYPGRALLVAATDDGADSYGRFLEEGFGPVEMPQGVTLIAGNPRTVSDFIEDALARPGRPLRDYIEGTDNLHYDGYLPRDYVFLDDDGHREDDGRDTARLIEDEFWRAAEATSSVDGYEAYLDRYPNGAYADEARARIDEFRADPYRNARAEEEALHLNRTQRREIQRDLSLLEYNTRGIDGIFGPGTRNAITKWQRDNGFEPTSFLNARLIERLHDQAERRAAELEAEAERRRAELERQDRAYWQQTGALGEEEGYRAYLKKYPDGLYAEIANSRLSAIERRKRERAEARDRAAWEQATNANTIRAYRGYLDAYPDGVFASEARSRIDALRAENNAENEQYARAEQRLGLGPTARRGIEQRLNALGLRPGPVDGVFDQRTRRAIRRYQSARGLPVTGYLDQGTVVRLLAESVLSIIDN